MKKIIKNQYQITTFIREDLISLTYAGKIVSSSVDVLIQEYKTENISVSHVSPLLEKLETLKSLIHPCILKIVDYEYEDGILYVIYERITAKPLTEVLKSGGVFSLEQVLELYRKIAEGLRYLYSHNVCHGTLNPDSIYILRNGDVKLAGYVVNNDVNTYCLQLNGIMDNAMFCAPEQLRRGVTTRASDMYALGVLLYRLMCGVYPFRNNCNVRKLLKEVKKGVLPPKKVMPRLPSFINQLILRMMRPERDERYKNLEQVLEVLQEREITEPVGKDNGESLHESGEDQQECRAGNSVPERRVFRRTVVVAVAALIFGGGFAYLYSLYLGYFSAIPEVVIPEVRGMPQETAVEALQQLGLIPEIAGGMVDSSISVNHIVSSLPEMGRVVKAGRTIRLFVSKGEGMTNLPNVSGMRVPEAMAMLQSAGMVPTINKYTFSNTFPKDVVIDQEPTPNTLVAPRTTVNVTVSSGYPVEFTVRPLSDDPTAEYALVQIKFAVIEGWEENKIRVDVTLGSNTEAIYEEIHRPGDVMLLEFEDHQDARVVIFFNGDIAFESRIGDYLRKR